MEFGGWFLCFSNFSVEAEHRILKGRYIHLNAPPHGLALEKVVEWAVKDYNDVWQHASLKGLTPVEAYSGVGVESLAFAEKVKVARTARNHANRRNSCKPSCWSGRNFTQLRRKFPRIVGSVPPIHPRPRSNKLISSPLILPENKPFHSRLTINTVHLRNAFS